MEKVLHKIETLFFNPKGFFNRLSHEKGYIRPIIYFALCYIIYVFFANITQILVHAKNGILAAGLVLFPIELILGAMAAFAFPFFASAVIHLGVITMRVDADFLETFKAVTYAGIVLIIYLLLIQVAKVIFLVLGISPYVNEMLVNIINAMVALGLFVLGFFHYLIALVTGLSMYQKINWLKALFSVFFVPLMLSVVAFFTIIFGIAIIASTLSATGSFAHIL